MSKSSLLLLVALASTHPAFGEVDLSLSKSINLLATCTAQDDGTIGFRTAKNEIERVFAHGRYERSIMSCMSFIQGVAEATIYSGTAMFCLPGLSLEDLRAVVVVNLKQKYKNEDYSVPLVLEALNTNWPCKE